MGRQPPINSLEWFDKVSTGVKDSTKDLPVLIRIPMLIVFYLSFPFLMFGFFVVVIPLLIIYLIFSVISRVVNGNDSEK